MTDKTTEELKVELDLVKDVLGNLVAWLGRELGQSAQDHLLDRLFPDATDHLLINKANKDHLMESIEQLEEGNHETKTLHKPAT